MNGGIIWQFCKGDSLSFLELDTILFLRCLFSVVCLCIQVAVYVHEEVELLCVQVQMEVMTSALHAFTLLADLTLRPLWDNHYL